MDIKIETKGGWTIKSEQRARKTTRGEGYTTVTAFARVALTGPDADSFMLRAAMTTRLESTKGHPYLPDSMKQWLGLGAEVTISTGGRWRANGTDCYDFGFSMTKRGRGHANYGKQFRGLLTELDKAGTLQEIAKRIVEDEIQSVQRANTEEARQFRLKSVAAYLVAEAREKADFVTNYRRALEELRQTRDDKMQDFLTQDLIEALANEHDLSVESLTEAVRTASTQRHPFMNLGG